MKIAPKLLWLGLHLPEWVWGRKALLDMSLMYMMINAMSKYGKFKA